MLRHTSEIKGFSIGASDGAIGSITDFLFDDITWQVRWIVVEIGHLLTDRKVLLPPSALGRVNHIGNQFSIRLTMQNIKDSPDIDTDEPVSRLMEANLYDYYGWCPYWSMGFNVSGYGYAGGRMAPLFPPGTFRKANESGPPQLYGDPHLRSVSQVTGYHIRAADGEVGHVADFLIEDADWSIHYLIVDTKNWWPGKKVLISPRSVQGIDWGHTAVDLKVFREIVKNSPEYDATVAIDRAYEGRFHDYYNRVTQVERV